MTQEVADEDGVGGTRDQAARGVPQAWSRTARALGASAPAGAPRTGSTGTLSGATASDPARTGVRPR